MGRRLLGGAASASISNKEIKRTKMIYMIGKDGPGGRSGDVPDTPANRKKYNAIVKRFNSGGKSPSGGGGQRRDARGRFA